MVGPSVVAATYQDRANTTQLMLAFYSDVAIAPLPNVYEIEIKPAVIRLAAFDIYSL